MNATHTPGPWRDSAYTCTERGRSGPTHAIVCDRDNGHNGSIVADYISNPANARLIAAAPALLAALEAYVAHVDAYGPTLDQHIRGGERPVIEAARAALRVARGS